MIFVLEVVLWLYLKRSWLLVYFKIIRPKESWQEDKCSGSYRKPKKELNGGQMSSETMRHSVSFMNILRDLGSLKFLHKRRLCLCFVDYYLKNNFTYKSKPTFIVQALGNQKVNLYPWEMHVVGKTAKKGKTIWPGSLQNYYILLLFAFQNVFSFSFLGGKKPALLRK